MCQQQRLALLDLPKRGAVKIEKVTDSALGFFNLAVDLVRGEIDKDCRNIDKQVSNLNCLSSSSCGLVSNGAI